MMEWYKDYINSELFVPNSVFSCLVLEDCADTVLEIWTLLLQRVGNLI